MGSGSIGCKSNTIGIHATPVDALTPEHNSKVGGDNRAIKRREVKEDEQKRQFRFQTNETLGFKPM